METFFIISIVSIVSIYFFILYKMNSETIDIKKNIFYKRRK